MKNKENKIIDFSVLKSRKAQIRMSETIAVLFIFFVLVFFGIIFYYKYSKISFQEKQEELLGKKATEITLKTLFLPELICSRGEAEQEDNCFDMMKLRQIEDVFKDGFSDYYFDLFPYSNITVTQVYPKKDGKPIEWNLYDKPKTKKDDTGKQVKDWTRVEKTYFVVTLKDELKTEAEGQHAFGYLTVGVYS
ncbi:hypothetical protein ACFL0E_00680 [Nanoarchaeota archaeon]